MGAWGNGPFENDGALDFLREVEDSPKRGISKVLERVRDLPGGAYIDVDDGQACVAACELVALGAGFGEQEKYPSGVRAFAARLGCDDKLVELALSALPRVLDRELSELAGLWHEGTDGEIFDAALVDLNARLRAANGNDLTSAPSLADLLGSLPARKRPAARKPRRAVKPAARDDQPRDDRPPNVRAMIESSPALRATTPAYADAWALTLGGVLNVYGNLSNADARELAGHHIKLLQFARRFTVAPTTLHLLDEHILAHQPDVHLGLVLNGYGAFDDLVVLASLPHLRSVGIDGDEDHLRGATARSVLAEHPNLVAVALGGEWATRS